MTLLSADICASIDTLAMTYLDDELADEELRDLELHLRDCGSCRDKVAHERSALAGLRRQLVAPPAPDVVRARLAAALDAEDAAGDRSWLTSWLLPGAASLVAAAALLLFFVGGPPAQPSPGSEVVAGLVRERQPQAVRPVSPDLQQPVVDRAAATWKSEVRGRDVTHMLFQIRTSWGDEIEIQGSVLDARGLEMCGDRVERVEIRGVSMCAAQIEGKPIIVHQDARGVAFVFSSRSWGLGARELASAVVEYRLVELVGARLGDR